MHFVFDIDETLVRGDIILGVSTEMYNAKELDKIYCGHDVTDFSLGGLPSNLIERVLQAFQDPKYTLIKTAIPEAYYFLCALTLHRHKISALTARPINLKNETLVNLVEQFPKIKFSNIEFCNMESNIKLGNSKPKKTDKLIKLNPDIYFDDCIDYCNMADNLGIETYLVSNSYTGWNQNRITLNPNVKILKHLGQFDYRRF